MNYRNGARRPEWRGGAPGRLLTTQENKLLEGLPFVDPTSRKILKPTNTQLGYFITDMEEWDSSKERLSDKYLTIYHKKYQPLVLRPRHRKFNRTLYHAVYPPGAKLPKPNTMEEASRTTCVFYPDQPKLLLKAPLQPAQVGPPYSESQEKGSSDPNKNNPLLELLQSHPTICETILNDAGYLGMAGLFQSCKRGMHVVSGMICLFDLATGDFANTEYTVPQYEKLLLNNQAVEGDIPHGYKVVQVSPGYLGFDPVEGNQKYPRYEKLAKGIVRLTRSFQLWGSTIEHLYLAKVPLMDVKLLGTWLKMLPNLKTLTIFRCEHIHMFDMVPLVDMVHEHRQNGSALKLDVAPFYELGPRNANFEGVWGEFDDNLTPSHDRKGTFGVTAGDVGVKIPAAVVEYLFYELLPKLDATGHMYLMSLDSLLRHYFERLPLPEHSTLRTLKAYEGARKWFNKAEGYISAANAEAAAAEAAKAKEAGEADTADTADAAEDETVKRPVFPFPDPESLPKKVLEQEAWERIRCYYFLAYAAFGDEDPHLQTLPDSCMSTNAGLRPTNFSKWGEEKPCSDCHIRMPCMFFPNACLCDKCRLKVACGDEDDHMKQRKKRVMAQLGCGHVNEPAKALEETNFDFSKLDKPDDSREAEWLQRRSNFDVILANDSPLHRFYDAARRMDAVDQTGRTGRMQFEQPDHPYSGASLAHHTVRDQLYFASYRQSYPVEDVTKYRRGRNARNTASQWMF